MQPQETTQQQNQTPRPQTHSNNAPKVEDVTYVSNPFITSLNGLVSIIKVNPVSSMLVTVVSMLIIVAFLIISALLVALGIPTIVAAILGILVYIIAIPLVTGSIYAVASSSLHNKLIKTSDAINLTFKKILPLLGLLILSGIMILIGLLLLIIPGLIVLGRISLATFIMFEENLGPIASLKRSMSLTKGHTVDMLGAIFAGAFIGFGGLIAPALGAAPIAERYKQLKSLEQKSAGKSKVHWLNYLVIVLPILLIGAYFALIAATFQNIDNANQQNIDRINKQNTDLFNNYDQTFDVDSIDKDSIYNYENYTN